MELFPRDLVIAKRDYAYYDLAAGRWFCMVSGRKLGPWDCEELANACIKIEQERKRVPKYIPQN